MRREIFVDYITYAGGYADFARMGDSSIDASTLPTSRRASRFLRAAFEYHDIDETAAAQRPPYRNTRHLWRLCLAAR